MRNALLILVVILLVLFFVSHADNLDMSTAAQESLDGLTLPDFANKDDTDADGSKQGELFFDVVNQCAVECLSDADCAETCKLAGSCEAYCSQGTKTNEQEFSLVPASLLSFVHKLDAFVNYIR